MVSGVKRHVTNSLWLQVTLTVVIGEDLTLFVAACGLVLALNVSLVVCRVESFQLLLLTVRSY